MKHHVFWIGPLLLNPDLINKKAVSPAANVWQYNFIDGLRQNDHNVTSLSYLPEPSWPNGPLWIEPHECGSDGSQFSVGYLNIAIIREWFIALNILRTFFKIKRSGTSYIFTYNALKRHLIVGYVLKTFFNIKWISIIADDIKKGNPDHNLFLSYNYFSKTTQESKIFCDGGIPQSLVSKKNLHPRVKSLVYSGSISEWTGIFEFTAMFSSMRIPDFHLNIYGKGDQAKLQELITKASVKNISVHGFVDDTTLTAALNNAYAFVNPRNTTLKNSENNFPSKLLLYLSYEKPIIATFSLGLSPEIRKVLLEYVDEKSFESQLLSLKNDVFYNDIVSKVKVYKKENSWKAKTQSVMDRIMQS